jgi:hypothetical protein
VIRITAGHRQKMDNKINCGDMDCENETCSGMLLL